MFHGYAFLMRAKGIWLIDPDADAVSAIFHIDERACLGEVHGGGGARKVDAEAFKARDARDAALEESLCQEERGY